MQLFELERVLAVEKSEEFIVWKKRFDDKRQALKDGAQKALQTKKEKVLVYINNLVIKVPKFEYETLLKRACEHYNDLWARRGDYEKCASVHDSRKFLHRIARNYLRHECTRYEDHLVNLFGCVYKDTFVEMLRSKIMAKIFEAYPVLKETDAPGQDTNFCCRVATQDNCG